MENFLSRYANGELLSADSTHFADSLMFKTLVSKRVVYGGGGIMPDIFVSADTTAYSDYYRDLIRQGVITQFTLGYTDNNREKLKLEYRNFSEFNEKFSFSADDIETFIKRGEASGIKYNEAQFKISEGEFLKIMKGLVARDIWDMNEYYMIVNHNDSAIDRALEVISDPARYNAVIGNK
jgi:carboxyl-terminal processing protease